MTKNDKIYWLMTHAPGPYARAREKALTELDELTPVFCFCGALATGLHTACCRKFQERLKTKIVKELGGLITSDKL